MAYLYFSVRWMEGWIGRAGRVTGIFVLGCLLAGVVEGQNVGVNLVANPGAETTPVTVPFPGTGLSWVDLGPLSNWCTSCPNTGDWYLPDNSTYPLPQHTDNGTHQAHSGNFFFSGGISINPGSGEVATLQQTIDLTSQGLANMDLVFNISAWVASDGNFQGGDVEEVKMEFRDNTENVMEAYDNPWTPASTSDFNWNNITGVVNVAATENVTHVVVTLIATNNNGSSTLQGFFDDISLIATLPLPVTLVDFHAVRQPDQTNALYWETAQEENSSYTEIQRSVDGKVFLPIGKVAAAGNSNSPRNYTYVDRQPPAGNDYYRLRMVDMDGSAKYSKVVLISGGQAGKDITVFSNPFHDRLEVHIPAIGSERLILTLMDATGRICLRQGYTTQAGIILSICIRRGWRQEFTYCR